MAGLFDEVDANAERPSKKSARAPARRRERALSPGVQFNQPRVAKRAKTSDNRLPSPPAVNPYGDDDDFSLPTFDDDVVMSDPMPSSPTPRAGMRKPDVVAKAEEDEDEDMMEVAQADGVAIASVNMSGTRPVPKAKKPVTYPTPDSSSPTRPPAPKVDAATWNDVTQKLNVLNSSQPSQTMSAGKLDHNDVIEDDGSLRMFWTDYSEVNGSLCLFGKVKNRKTGTFASCFVKVDNILRKLFFLPRAHRQRNGRDTTEEVEMKDVYEEVDELMSKMNVGEHKIKPCTRKYAFELLDVPKEADYLKLLYPYTSKILSHLKYHCVDANF